MGSSKMPASDGNSFQIGTFQIDPKFLGRVDEKKAVARPNQGNGSDLNRDFTSEGRLEIEKNLAWYLGIVRAQAHVTQEEMAEYLGCSASRLSKIECGSARLNFETLLGYSQKLRIPVEILIHYGEDNVTPLVNKSIRQLPDLYQDLSVAVLNAVWEVCDERRTKSKREALYKKYGKKKTEAYRSIARAQMAGQTKKDKAPHHILLEEEMRITEKLLQRQDKMTKESLKRIRAMKKAKAEKQGTDGSAEEV